MKSVQDRAETGEGRRNIELSSLQLVKEHLCIIEKREGEYLFRPRAFGGLILPTPKGSTNA